MIEISEHIKSDKQARRWCFTINNPFEPNEEVNPETSDLPIMEDYYSKKSMLEVEESDCFIFKYVKVPIGKDEFETKDYLLKEFLQELFCHIFDSAKHEHVHKHIFECDAPDSVILHLIMHLQKNDNNVLRLLSCKNNELVLGYFKENLKKLFEEYLYLFDDKKSQEVPKDLWLNHVASTFVQTITWWIENGKKEDAETLSNYFFKLI